MDTDAGLQQVLEFGMKEASLKAQVELENMIERWKDTKQRYHKALVQVSQHLEHIGDGLMEVRRSLDGLSGQTAEIEKLDMEIRQGEERLQELFMERAHLKERSTTLQARVKNMEDEIKRDFLDPKPIGLKNENACVGTLGKEEDQTMRIGALRLEGVNICHIGAIRQNSKRKKLEPIQADPGSDCSMELHEKKYVKRTVKPRASSKDILEEEMLKKVAEVRRKTRRRNDDESSLDLRFVSTTVHGKKFSALIDTGATHSFLSRKAASSFRKKKASMEKELSAFKVVNLSMKAVNGVMKDTHVRVGSWFGKIDLRVIDMDDHSMVLGRDFMVAAQAIPMMDRDILLILDDGKTVMVPMTRKSRLGYQPRMASLILYEKDPDMDHTNMEQRELGSMTQTTKEEHMFDFVGRELKERRKGADIASFLEHVAEKSTQDLHQDDVKKDTSSNMGPGKDYAGRDLAGIVEFCRYAMGIYDFQLTKDKLGTLGCTQEEVDAVHEYLKTRHQSDTWVDESQGGSFLALALK